MEIKDEKKLLRKLAISKRLNFLIGSGSTLPAIPLMNDKEYRISSNEDKDWEELTNDEKADVSNNLLAKISKISTALLAGGSFEIDLNDMQTTLNSYISFLQSLVEILNLSNSRQTPRNANIFTTNYDLFIEKSMDKVMKDNRLVFNDGSNGYFDKILESSNYNKVVAYKGLNDNYISELPSITLIKPHGSVNWERVNDHIRVKNQVVDDPVIVNPTGYESRVTFSDNHFHDMLRVFQLELDKPQSVLFVIGFSFQDKHIAKMVKRALQNPELRVYIFGYSEDDEGKVLKNLEHDSEKRNLKIFTPSNFYEENEDKLGLTLSTLTELLSEANLEDLKDDDSK